MGGRGSGGHRPGSGKKPVLAVDFTQTPESVEPPSSIKPGELAIWEELAPFALDERTLVPRSAHRFLLLCRAVAMERSMAEKIETDGWTYIAVTVDGSGQERESLKAHPLCAAHRSMMQRVEAGMVAFGLAPLGKPMATKREEKQLSALERLQAQRNGIRAVS